MIVSIKTQYIFVILIVGVLSSCLSDSFSYRKIFKIEGVHYYSDFEDLEIVKQTSNSAEIKLQGNSKNLNCRFYQQTDFFTSKEIRRLLVKNIEYPENKIEQLFSDTTYHS